jgi:hypothetical protein
VVRAADAMTAVASSHATGQPRVSPGAAVAASTS